MVDRNALVAILNSLKDPVVFVTPDHVIRHMNDAAARHYEEGWDLLGRSLLDCHNEKSCAVIREVLARLEAGEEERLITDTPERRIYMRAVRDGSGALLGYYERYEYPSGAPSAGSTTTVE
ncbi:MAG: PAS domain-containing protein [Candidatus Latescibacterota bacterium]|nr:MAG: PAS domain-containing protein [Candidatus Latescibacterota bacterium]